MLNGVNAAAFNPNRNNPAPKINHRRLEVSLNFRGGIGINQIIAQITKKINRFNAFPLKAYSVFAYLRITGSVFFEKLPE